MGPRSTAWRATVPGACGRRRPRAPSCGRTSTAPSSACPGGTRRGSISAWTTPAPRSRSAFATGPSCLFPSASAGIPSFLRPPGTRLSFRAATRFARDARCLPVAEQPTDGLDGDEASYEGLDTHFAGWDGVAEIGRPDLRRLVLSATGAWAGNLQVFAPSGGRVLCVEPVSHVPDAPNRPALAKHGPMAVLPPGGTLSARLVMAAGDA